MPELPEVETIRRYLKEVLVGHKISLVPHLDERMVKHSTLDAKAIASRLRGQTVHGLQRQGKFLLLQTDGVEGLVLHLGMSGRLTWERPEKPWERHTHLIIAVGDGEMRLVDPRRFGRVAWVKNILEPGLSLGCDPFSHHFTGSYLAEVLSHRMIAIKSALLDQSLVAGLGNIYADEALFRCRIHPARPAGSLSREELGRLVRAIRHVLKVSLANRGTSFSDYVDALGHPGDNLAFLRVYARNGQPCVRCRHPINRMVIGGRSSHFCPHCQPLSIGTEGRFHAKV